MKKEKINKILKIEINNEIIKKILLYFLAFFIPAMAILGTYIYLKIYPFGENTYLPVDSYDQYVSFLKYFKNIFLGDEGIFYSLGKSLGGETYGLIAYYLASPFNFISLFFKDSDMSIGIAVIFMLKAAASGITFMYYLNRHKKADFRNLIFSVSYAFCSYVITYGFNIMWMDSVILFPILAIRYRKYSKEKRFQTIPNSISTYSYYKLLYRIYGMYIFFNLFYIHIIIAKKRK